MISQVLMMIAWWSWGIRTSGFCHRGCLCSFVLTQHVPSPLLVHTFLLRHGEFALTTSVVNLSGILLNGIYEFLHFQPTVVL